jgi:hypothetical protein
MPARAVGTARIAAQAAKDPTLLSTFKEQFIVDNWHGYEDIVAGDQPAVDMVQAKIASPDPENHDFSDDQLQRTDEWAKVIDIMFAGMQEYGGVKPMPVTMGPVTTTVINPKTGTPVPTSIAPGATVATKPPTPSGISTNTLLVGGGIAAALLAVILAMKA